MNVTRHAKERWIQRINPEAGEDAEKQILEAFADADYVWFDEEVLYYINNDRWMFVVDEGKKNIVTVFKIDYGFPSDINKLIVSELIDKVVNLRVEHDQLKQESEEVIKLKQSQIGILEAERGQLINQANILFAKIKALEEEIRIEEQEVKNVEYELEKLLKQLVGSNLYRKNNR